MGSGMRSGRARRVIVYRLGSIGDFVVALPALHVLRGFFSQAEIILLTNRPAEAREAPAQAVLEGTGLVDGYISYPVATRSPRELWTVAQAIRGFAPDLLVYLMPPGGLLRTIRDDVFFRCCGARTAAMPFARNLRERMPRRDGSDLWESEAHRLLRCVAEFGIVAPTDEAGWDLHLSRTETADADAMLSTAFGQPKPDRPIIAASIGTKQTIKDWGDGNWQQVLKAVGRADFGLLLVGAEAERDRSARLAEAWPGPVANLCGLTSPRVSAAALRRAQLFVGHDSGPMHLAAAVGTRCVVVFSAKNRPGEWFPFGRDHKILYPPIGANSIRAILPGQVIDAIQDMLRALARPVSSAPVRVTANQ